jgi:hypothetical protein
MIQLAQTNEHDNYFPLLLPEELSTAENVRRAGGKFIPSEPKGGHEETSLRLKARDFDHPRREH